MLKVIGATGRLLTFRITREELLELGWPHLLFGLFCTWIVGIGRYWDNPRVPLLQHLGIGSVVYVIALSFFLWIIALPLRPKAWTYLRVLTFVSLTSPPALLYAIPVEKFFSLEAARTLNVWFLAIVASWRVALLCFYLKRHGRLQPFSILVATLLPLTIIVVTLTTLNLERAVFNVMAGLNTERTANDGAYIFLIVLGWLSIYMFIPLLICYIFIAASKFRTAKKAVGP